MERRDKTIEWIDEFKLALLNEDIELIEKLTNSIPLPDDIQTSQKNGSLD